MGRVKKQQEEKGAKETTGGSLWGSLVSNVKFRGDRKVEEASGGRESRLA